MTARSSPIRSVNYSSTIPLCIFGVPTPKKNGGWSHPWMTSAAWSFTPCSSPETLPGRTSSLFKQFFWNLACRYPCTSIPIPFSDSSAAGMNSITNIINLRMTQSRNGNRSFTIARSKSSTLCPLKPKAKLNVLMAGFKIISFVSAPETISLPLPKPTRSCSARSMNTITSGFIQLQVKFLTFVIKEPSEKKRMSSGSSLSRLPLKTLKTSFASGWTGSLTTTARSRSTICNWNSTTRPSGKG